MPVNVKVTVTISRQLREAASRGPQIVLQKLREAMGGAVLIVESKAKEYITEIGLIDQGRLRNSIHGRVVSANLQLTVGEVATTNVKYARIHEYGGRIVPKNGKALAIPFNKQSAQLQAISGSLRNVAGLYVVKRGGRAFLFKSGDPTVGWTLVKSVTITEKRFMRTGLERAMPLVRVLFQRATQDALKAVLGKGGAG